VHTALVIFNRPSELLHIPLIAGVGGIRDESGVGRRAISKCRRTIPFRSPVLGVRCGLFAMMS